MPAKEPFFIVATVANTVSACHLILHETERQNHEGEQGYCDDVLFHDSSAIISLMAWVDLSVSLRSSHAA